MIGQRLGPYEITAKLGEGGMGEVWRATDSRLKREVAIKVLPAAFTSDRERLARFEREAQTLAQLHHPNIASIFGLEESDGTRALVMELVEGEELAAILARGPLPPGEAVAIGRQIAEALEAAHERGIVHRDLKPANVKVRPDGTVKVLDFGLAKAMEPGGGAAPAVDLARSPTLTAAHGTALGVILGTAAYMSPEQARGGAVDKRADVWAFGVVLFEMLTGRSLFAGETVSDTLAGVLKSDVDLAALPAGTPLALRELLRRCLERNPRSRLHDIADARIVLEEVLAGRGAEATGPAATAAAAPPRAWPWLAAAGLLVGVALGGAGALLWSGRGRLADTVPRAVRFAIQPPAGTTFERGIAVSPDGRHVTFAARDLAGRVTLWVRALDTLEPRQLPDTDDARLPFWAPDSRRIGFFSQRSLKWVDIRGGTPLVIAETSSVQDVRGAAWGAGDTILYAPGFTGPLLAVSARGGPSAPATELPADGSIGTMRFPSFLPDGRRFVFFASSGTGTEPGHIHLGRLGSTATKRLGAANSSAVFAAPGYLVFVSGESLFAQRFDERAEELTGELIALGMPMGGSLAVSGLRSLSAASDGTLVARDDKRNASRLVWVDRRGEELGALTDGVSSWNYAPRLSPDGRLLVAARYSVPIGTNGEIWVQDIERGLATRLTFEGDDFLPLWVRPGSREVLYNSARPGATGAIYRLSVDRPGVERPWLGGDATQNPVAVTPDGRRVVFERDEGLGHFRLWIRDLDGEAEPTRLGSASGNAAESSGDVSPDGRWLAYASDATRRWEVYVRPLDGEGGVVRISAGGGTHPAWRADGRELFYLDPQGRLVAVPIVQPAAGADGAPAPGEPQVLFAAALEEAADRQYDVSADGQRFVLNRSTAINDAPLVVILGWSDLLDRQRGSQGGDSP